MKAKLGQARKPVIEWRRAAARAAEARPPQVDRPIREPAPVSPADEPLVLDGYLPYRFALLSAHLGQALFERHHGFSGLSVPQWRVVAVLGPAAALSAAEIASTSRLDQVAVHRAVKGLLEMGYAVRGLAGSDMRRKPVKLTRRGQAIYWRIVPLARELEREMLAHLDRPQELALRSALGGICAAFGLAPMAGSRARGRSR
jgi:DNA-binding MarR family transcriptional regulator